MIGVMTRGHRARKHVPRSGCVATLKGLKSACREAAYLNHTFERTRDRILRRGRSVGFEPLIAKVPKHQRRRTTTTSIHGHPDSIAKDNMKSVIRIVALLAATACGAAAGHQAGFYAFSVCHPIAYPKESSDSASIYERMQTDGRRSAVALEHHMARHSWLIGGAACGALFGVVLCARLFKAPGGAQWGKQTPNQSLDQTADRIERNG